MTDREKLEKALEGRTIKEVTLIDRARHSTLLMSFEGGLVFSVTGYYDGQFVFELIEGER